MSDSFIPHSAVFVDLSWAEYLGIFTKFAKPANRFKLQESLEKSFIQNPQTEKLLPVLSVRTGFDLFLQAAAFPIGSEIIMTGINIPEMKDIVTHHGFVPVPINVSFDTLEPTLEDVEKVITEKTRAIVISYVFGTHFSIDKIVELCKKHNIYVVEDLAETFRSTKMNGHPEATVSLYSFGTIKYNTSLAGGITIVRNDEVLYRKMKYILENYPMQTNAMYLKKCLKCFLPFFVTASSVGNYMIRRGGELLRFDYSEYAIKFMRGFAKDADFLEKFRFQVSTPLLSSLAERMENFDNEKFEEYLKRLREVQDLLVKNNVQIPGFKSKDRSFWLFPVIVPDVDLCLKMFRKRGIDAYLGATQLQALEAPHGSKFGDTKKTQEFFKNILYLPIHKQVTAEQLQEICKRTIDIINTAQRMQEKPKL